MAEVDDLEEDSPQEQAPTRKEILAIAALLLLLERRHHAGVKAALRAAPPHLLKLGAGADHVERGVRAVTSRALLNLRETTRAEAAERWARSTKLRLVPHDTSAPDAARAQSAANALAARWRELVDGAVAEGADIRHASAWALDDMDPSAERTATTETIDAWNSEVDRQNTAAASAGYLITETWEGILDTRVCPECEAMIGESVTRPDRFPELPPLHPRCRCFLSTIVEVNEMAA